MVVPPSTFTMAYVLVRDARLRGFSAPSRGSAAAKVEMRRVRRIARRCMAKVTRDSGDVADSMRPGE